MSTNTAAKTRPTMNPLVRQARMRRLSDHMMWMAAGRAEAKAAA